MSQTRRVDSVFRAAELSLGYGRTPVLRDDDLDVRQGEFWFLLGPNGSGKTTLLRGFLGQLAPRAGTLVLDPERASFRAIGFVPQSSTGKPGLPTTLREFVALGLVGLSVRGGERRARVREALSEVELDGREADPVAALSGGQLRRAMLARALVRRPRTLILDEPTTGLDLTSRHSLIARLVHLHGDHGLTVVVVTHELDLAARYASHVALFSEGSLLAGARDQVLTRELLEPLYGLKVRVDADGVYVAAPVPSDTTQARDGA